MIGDFPDRDEWTDRNDRFVKIESEKEQLERERQELLASYDEAAEWDALGETDLIDLNDLKSRSTP